MTVVKNAQPERPAGLRFTAGGGLCPASFSSTTTPTPTLSNTRTFSDVSPQRRLLARRDRAERLGPVERDLRRRQPGVEHRRRPRRDVTCTFTNRKRGADRGRRRTRSPNDPQDFSFTAGGGLRPSSFQLDDDSDGRSRTRARSRTCRPRRLLGRRDAAGRLAARRRIVRRRQPAVEHRRRPRARPSPARSTNSKRGQIVVVEGRDARTTRRTSRFTAGGGLSPGELPARRRLRRDALQHAHVQRHRARQRLLGRPRPCRAAGTRPARPATTAARPSNIDVSAGETVTCTFTNRKRGKIVVVKDAMPERPAGLHVHRGRRPVARELPARRRLRRDAVEHAHVQRRRAGHRLLGVRERAERLEPGERHLQRRQPHVEHRRGGGRDRHVHVREHRAATRGRRARRRFAPRWSSPTRTAPPRTARTARRSSSPPATRRRSPRTT